ncbi:hypothetical protein C2E25_05315 [Geothermobacter hydrogeniphilus]|uniref:Type IV pilus assembly protein PilN n=1 Tax=Geothermobacter hydrogeniphilus TaxID=1969733 RepID=A0A2K2HBW4_9BACT|nr:PilN domain-containing protein [Geothermobacter hydrogeniphilus]PNU20805.1 hypothetical protein C2E25_05315 [Geothermobacter hydrogeniphilus]
MRPTINLATHGHLNRRALYAGYVCLCAVLLLGLGVQLADWRASARQSRLLQQRIGELESQLGINADSTPINDAEFSAQLKEIRFSNQIIARDSYRWSLLLSRLEEVLPAKVRITSIRPQFKDGTILLRGEARKVEDLQEFLDRLQKSAAFRDVLLLDQALKAAGREMPGSQGVMTFGIKVRRGKV